MTRYYFLLTKILHNCFLLGTCLIVLASFFSSCGTTKESFYFQTLKKDTSITGFVSDDFESKIKSGDNLGIIVTSLSKEEDLIFNQAAGEISFVGSGAATSGFLVNKDGTIKLHRLGDVKADGLTRKQLAANIQQSLLPYMKDPIVHVNYLNRKITVMGEVEKPQVLYLPGEQISLIDAIVLSGDVTDESKRNDILIIREEGEIKKIKHVNLEDHSILTSPWYYVKSNDIVYVMKDAQKAERIEKRNSLRTTLSLVASGISLIIIIIDRIIK